MWELFISWLEEKWGRKYRGLQGMTCHTRVLAEALNRLLRYRNICTCDMPWNFVNHVSTCGNQQLGHAANGCKGHLPEWLAKRRNLHEAASRIRWWVCLLVRPLYGLKQAENEWNNKFDSAMKDLMYIHEHLIRLSLLFQVTEGELCNCTSMARWACLIHKQSCWEWPYWRRTQVKIPNQNSWQAIIAFGDEDLMKQGTENYHIITDSLHQQNSWMSQTTRHKLSCYTN